ncbi:hypothetical protein LINGRAHAP2_LOCUS19984 [Linum grandiflorum]
MREEDDSYAEDEDDPLCPSIAFTAAEKVSFRREWRSALVVKGLGRRISYLPLARRLNYIWARNGSIQITDLHNGCYLVRFRERDDYENAVSGGPWMLGDTYLTVHRWFRGFNPWTTEIKTSLVWVQLPDLPIEFHNPVAVMRIASRIGKPVRVDRATAKRARAKFARVCVEIDLTKPLLSKYKVEGVQYYVGYEGLENLCTNCGRYGASTSRCSCRDPPKIPEPEPEVDAVEMEEAIQADTEPIYGSWMHSRPRRRRGRRGPGSVVERSRPTSSASPAIVANQFSVLQETVDLPTPVPTSKYVATTTITPGPTLRETGNNTHHIMDNPLFSNPPIVHMAPINKMQQCSLDKGSGIQLGVGSDAKKGNNLLDVNKAKKGVGSMGPSVDPLKSTHQQMKASIVRGENTDGAGNLSSSVNK